MPENIESLPPGFPSFVLDPGFGQWWKVHSKPYGPWFFVSDDAQRHLIGRFDFPAPNGTLYVGDCLGGVTPESVREENVTAAESQRA